MGYEQYAATQLERVHETSEIVPMGGFQFARSMQLAHMYARLGKHGTAVGAERFRINIYTDSAMTKLYAQSGWSDLATAVGASAHWIGRLRFDFDGVPDPEDPRGPHIDKEAVYYAGIEADGYTRNGDTFYVSWGLDYPEPINTQLTSGAYALEMLFAGFLQQ